MPLRNWLSNPDISIVSPWNLPTKYVVVLYTSHHASLVITADDRIHSTSWHHSLQGGQPTDVYWFTSKPLWQSSKYLLLPNVLQKTYLRFLATWSHVLTVSHVLLSVSLFMWIKNTHKPSIDGEIIVKLGWLSWNEPHDLHKSIHFRIVLPSPTWRSPKIPRNSSVFSQGFPHGFGALGRPGPGPPWLGPSYCSAWPRARAPWYPWPHPGCPPVVEPRKCAFATKNEFRGRSWTQKKDFLNESL